MLGDAIAKALSTVGVSHSRVEAWVGGPCGCAERQAKLNSLSLWARRVAQGKLSQAKEYLAKLVGESNP